MKARNCALVCAILIAVPALAQIDPQSDGVGIYADLGAMTAGVEQQAGVPLEVYLLMTNPSSELLYAGWEMGISVPDNAQIWGFNFPQPGALAFIDDNNFTVGWGTYVPLQTVNLLMTFIITPLDDEVAYFGVTRNMNYSYENEPGYLVQYNEIIPLHPYVNDLGVCFALNADNSLPTENATLDQVKALYR